MRKKFAGFFPASNELLDQLWTESVIVFDANALLNLYRYTAGAREAMFRAMESLGERLWVPHQVAHEFHQNRPGVIRSQEDFAQRILGSLSDLRTQVNEKLGQHRKNGLIDVVSLIERMQALLQQLENEVERSEYEVKPTSDPIVERLANVLDGRVGESFSESDLAVVIEEAEKRFAKRVPPGFRDAAKAGERAYGDYILWRQVLDYSKSGGHNVLLVTDDTKDDWWWNQAGYSLGPLPALREEFMSVTSKLFWMYRPARFLAELRRRQAAQVSDEDLLSIRDASSQLQPVETALIGSPAAALADLEFQRASLLERIESTDAMIVQRQADYERAVRTARRAEPESENAERRRSRAVLDHLKSEEIEVASRLDDSTLSDVERNDLKRRIHSLRAERHEILRRRGEMRRRSDDGLMDQRMKVLQVKRQREKLQTELADVEKTLSRHYSPPD